MKTIKPLRLGILTRPYRRQRRDMLGVAVFALVDIARSPTLLTDQELWQIAAAEGIGALDLATPKLHPEALVSGHAYPHDSGSPGACAVRMKLGSIDKSLLVFGDRYWLDGKVTAPQPFERMRLDWSRAYGGPGVAENPLGIGAQDEDIHGVRTRRLPNIEHPLQRLGSPAQRVAPVCFAPLPAEWPQRAAHMGRDYGQEWLEHDFPGFASDMDWRFFNAAQPDQWGPPNTSFTGGAEYELWNMHPAHPVLRGRLPSWRARCFFSREADGAALQELDLRLSTAWFFPERAQMALIWHGAAHVREDDAADVRHIMPALEHAQLPRDMAHYEEVLRQRLDPELGPVYALLDAQLVPEDICGELAEPEAPDARPSNRNVHAGAARRHARERESLLAQGLDPDLYMAPLDPPPAAPRLADLPQTILRLQREMEDAKRLSGATAARALEDPNLPGMAQVAGVDLDALRRLDGAGKPAAAFDPRKLKRHIAEFDTSPHAQARRHAPGAGDASPPLSETLGAQVHQAYQQSAHHFAPPPPMPPLRAQRTRRKLEARLKGNRDCRDMNLTGADLSGMDLSNVDFQRAILAGARLVDARLDGSDLTDAVLTGADLTGACMRGATLTRANLGNAHCLRTDFSLSQITETTWDDAFCEDCNFSGSAWRLGRLHKARLLHCDLRRATFSQWTSMNATLEDCDFRESSLDQCVFMQGTLENARFDGATLMRVSFMDVGFPGRFSMENAALDGCAFAGRVELTGARLQGLRFNQGSARGAILTGADMRGARLSASDFSECQLQDADLSDMSAPDTHFVRADFTGARLRNANLINSLLGKAIFLRADLTGANLFRADVAQTRMDDSTSLDNAYTQGAKRWPVRQPETPA
ncbi:DUF2169 family type VI secretion system accessory protein [Achromobacter arsenitoxydans]|uniref:Pentapeptide repeats family protein n=1 Tax=Achromobacter arsenitoxydans SY8 TaxID=477184 RepID=H0FG08_9BURK|nr:DUF2169 domain-containing protein [Achromobacter arsenitoxydans]EHK62801.1 pentapeptide repeats family protein [Achromobacter arsenitoxydans SY8]